jgi:transcriptional regulator with XRE-family HTH domain
MANTEKGRTPLAETLKVSPKSLREANELNQIEFWEKVGITQSGGSRYENGDRKMPPSLVQILRLTYVEKVDLADVSRDAIEVAKLLKKDQPDLYASLLSEAKLRRKNK